MLRRVFADRTLVESAGLQQSDVSTYFSDPERDVLTYAATSSDSRVAAVGIAGATLAIATHRPGYCDGGGYGDRSRPTEFQSEFCSERSPGAGWVRRVPSRSFPHCGRRPAAHPGRGLTKPIRFRRETRWLYLAHCHCCPARR